MEPDARKCTAIDKAAAAADEPARPEGDLSAFLAEHLAACQVLCCDYFDTLVTRSVYPEQTKKLAAAQLSAILDGRLSGATIYELRREIESNLCRQNALAGRDPEFNLAELAVELQEMLTRMAILPTAWTSPDSWFDLFASIEVAVECQVQIPRPAIVAALREAKAQGKQVCIISDFYIPAAYFKRMLVHHGLTESVDQLLVSCDHGQTKGIGGELYVLAAKALGCSPAEMLMIGDNRQADYTMALRQGLTPFLLDTTAQRQVYDHLALAEEKNGGRAQLNSDFAGIFAAYSHGLFAEMGLSLWYFTHRLFELLIAAKAPAVFFCSKEGEFLLQLFKRYQQQRFGCQPIRCHYLLVSRKATYIASLRPLASEDFSGLFTHYRDISLDDFLRSLNFSPVQAEEICRELGLDGRIRRPGLAAEPDFAQLLSSPVFQELYEDHRQTQSNCLRRYLRSFGEDLAQTGLNLVDVGWKGSIQNNIQRALGGEIVVQGYYLGLLSPTGLSESNRKTGVLFSDMPGHSPFIHVFNNNRSLFEMLLGASHGSADGYFPKSQFAAISLARQSTIMVEVADGAESIGVTTLDLPEERQLFKEKIEPIQASFEHLHDQLTGRMVASLARVPTIEWFARRHGRMVFQPRQAEVDFFSRLYHLENFGIFEFTDFLAGSAPSLLQRLRNLLLLKKDPAAFLETGVWQPVILQRLGLGFLQPIDGAKRHRRLLGHDPEQG